MTHEPNLLTPVEAAEILRVTLGTLRNWRYHRTHIRFVKAGRLVFYQAEDVDDFRERFHRIVEVNQGDEPRPTRRRRETTPDGIVEVHDHE